MRLVLGILSAPFFVALIGWGAAALWFDGPASRPLAGLAAAAFVVLALTALLWTRPRWYGVLALAALFAILLVWWLSIAPRNDRNWYRDVRVTPTAELAATCSRSTASATSRIAPRRTGTSAGRTAPTTSRSSAASISSWRTGVRRRIAHTIMSWEFEGGLPLAVSIETRKEDGESYSAVRGFFRQYELYYVVADERDVIGLRTNQRGEQVFLYRLRTPVARARGLLLSYVDAMNGLARTPRWYNAFTQNCTTTIETHYRQIAADGGPTPCGTGACT
jgi:hypothetical protein